MFKLGVGKVLLSRRLISPKSVFKAGVVFLLVVLMFAGLPVKPAYAAVCGGNTYMYRSATTGDWAADATWEVSTDGGTNWGPAGCWPSSNNGTIQIQSGHVVTVTAAISADQTTIDAGGQVTVNSGITWTIANGTDTDLTVNGTIVVNGVSGNEGTISTTGATVVFNNGGKYQHNFTTANGTVPTATWNSGSTVEFIGYTSNSTVPAGLIQSFSNFTWNCPNQTANINFNGYLRTVNGNLTVTSTGTGSIRLTGANALTLNIGGNLTVTSGLLNSSYGASNPTVNVGGNVALNGGTLDAGSSGVAAYNIAGNWMNNGGTFTPRTGTVTFNGSSAQTINGSASTTFNNLTVNNSSGVALGANETVNGALTFTAGKITTGTNTLILGSSGSVSGAGAGKYVYGNLQKSVATGSPTVTFEVGGASNYAPISVTFNNVTAGGTLTGSTTDDLTSHLGYGSIGFTTDYINRYWTLAQSGLTFTSYDATFNFVAGDYVGSPSPGAMVVQKYDGTWSHATSTTATATTATGTGFTGFSSFAIGNDTSSTPVTLSYFAANRSGSGVAVDWSTATETGNLGFNLYAVEDGQIKKLNAQMIPSQKVDSLEQQDYSFQAETGGTVFYLEEVNLQGQGDRHGPYMLGEPYGGRVDENQIDWAAIQDEHGLAQETRQAVLKPYLAAVPGNSASLTLKVRQTGLYRVTYEMLKSAGLDLAGVPLTKITLTNRGQNVPIYVKGAGQFGPGAYLEFYGEALDTLYTDTNVYTLQVSQKQSPRIPVTNRSPSRAIKPVANYNETLVVNNQRAYANYAPGADPWYDTEMLVLTTPKTWSFPFQVDGLRAAPASLEVVVWGVTDWPQSPDHHLLVSVNGVLLAGQTFDGLVEERIKLNLPAGLLQEGTNTLELTLPGDTGVEAELVTLDKFSVTYPRAFRAREGRLTFTAAGKVFKVTNLPNKDVVVYRQDKNGIVKLGQVQVRQSGNTFTATFAGTGRAATYLVSSVEALYAPTFEAVRQMVNMNHPADYLVIAHPDFIAGIQPLIQARWAQGLTVSVVNVTDLYTRYSYGIFDPYAIQKYIAYAVQKLGTKYILLVGGDTYDYRDYLGINSISFIPSLYARTGPIANFVPADPLYADVNGDNAPDAAIGRFPVRTVAELNLMVNKTLAYAAKDYGRTAVFASDLNDGSTSFKEISNELALTLPGGWSVENIHLDDTGVTTARSQLLAAMNRGTALVTFTGHSGPQEWTFSNLFNIQDAAALTNAGKPFVVVQWGCWNNYYVDPLYNYLVQSFLLSGDRGAAAVLGATTLADSTSEQLLGQLLTPRLAQPGMTLGRALQLSKRELAQTHPDLLDVLLGWSLMGDPALVIQP